MINQRMSTTMNEQIKYELESYYIYLSMVAYFHFLSLDGMAHWLRCQAHEEMIHAMKFFDHILDRGGTVTLLDLQQLKTTWVSPRSAWEDAYAHEQFITGKINSLMKIAREENEYLAEPLLVWFANEQIEEENNTDRIARQIAMIENDQAGILMLDRELGTRVFSPGSPLDRAAYQAAQ
jgi:ferritin